MFLLRPINVSGEFLDPSGPGTPSHSTLHPIIIIIIVWLELEAWKTRAYVVPYAPKHRGRYLRATSNKQQATRLAISCAS